MRRSLIVLIILSLVMSPCWSQTITISSQELTALKNEIVSLLNELEALNQLVPKLQESLRIAKQKLADSAQSGMNSDDSIARLEENLRRAKEQQALLASEVLMLKKQLETQSVYLKDLGYEIEVQRDTHTKEIKTLTIKYERKIKRRNTIIIVETSIIVLLGVVLGTFIAVNANHTD